MKKCLKIKHVVISTYQHESKDLPLLGFRNVDSMTSFLRLIFEPKCSEQKKKQVNLFLYRNLKSRIRQETLIQKKKFVHRTFENLKLGRRLTISFFFFNFSHSHAKHPVLSKQLLFVSFLPFPSQGSFIILMIIAFCTQTLPKRNCEYK